MTAVQRTDTTENNMCWLDQMQKKHARALKMFKNVLLSNGYLSVELAFADMKNSYAMFQEFFNAQEVEFSDAIKTNIESLQDHIEIALKNIEIRFKLV